MSHVPSNVGTCPKCGVGTMQVYGEHEIADWKPLAIGGTTGSPYPRTFQYAVCDNCGYVEIYAVKR